MDLSDMEDIILTFAASMLWSYRERSKYLFSLALSLGSSVLGAITFYLNASFRNQTTAYGVDFVTYMTSSVLISALLMRWISPPSSFKISLIGDPVYVVMGQMAFSSLYQLAFAVPSMWILVTLGAKPVFGINILMIIIVFFTSISISTMLTLSEALIPGSNVVRAVYNSLNAITSGMWFVPTALGKFLPIVYLAPQFWIGEGIRYAVLGRSIVNHMILAFTLMILAAGSLLLSRALVIHAGRRGGFR